MRKTAQLMAGSIAIILGGATFVLADVAKLNPDSAEHFPMADANSDGGLTLEEFKNFVELEAEDNIGKSRNLKRFKMYNRGFSMMDSDEDGALTAKEIAAFQASM